jgi:hypothetical protein
MFVVLIAVIVKFLSYNIIYDTKNTSGIHTENSVDKFDNGVLDVSIG